MEVIVFFWVLSGIVAALIGSSKGGSGFGWFILGLLFGPLAWLFAAIKSPANTEASTSSHELRKCPYCAELIKYEATVCKHCKSNVEAVTTPEDTSVKGRLFRLKQEYESDSITKMEYQNKRKAILEGGEA